MPCKWSFPGYPVPYVHTYNIVCTYGAFPGIQYHMYIHTTLYVHMELSRVSSTICTYIQHCMYIWSFPGYAVPYVHTYNIVCTYGAFPGIQYHMYIHTTLYVHLSRVSSTICTYIQHCMYIFPGYPVPYVHTYNIVCNSIPFTLHCQFFILCTQ